jgi:hypothetical protein
MRIDEMVRIQASFTQKSKGKNSNIGKEITDKTQFNIIEALMGKIKGKKGKGKNKAEMPPMATQANPAYNVSLSGPRPPDWDRIYTKREPAMSDEEFEEAIKALAVEYADRAMEIGNSGKSSSMINNELYKLAREFEEKQYKLQLPYVSVISPDRKAAYATANFTESNSVYGNVPNIYGENKLMMWGPGGWNTIPTYAEQERIKKFNNIYVDTLKAHQAEYGPIPYSTISKTIAPNRNYL